MMVTEQVDALRAIGANHVKFLVVPRLLAGVVVFPLLTSIANVVGMIGGLLVAMFQYRLDHLLYWNTIVEISVGSAEQPRLPDGATLQVEERLDVAAFIGQGQRVLGHAERVAASLDTMLSTLEESKTPEAIAGAARTLERIAASMERGEGAIPWLIQDPASRRLVQDMARAAEAVGALAKEVKEGQGLAHVLIDDPEGAKLVQESRDLVKKPYGSLPAPQRD
ncbi:MAG: ABC transporter permease [Candidatus Methylomirabilis sp.]|nr:ABC transporter permease [Candidatus Methylomirabilis sp.]